jgi:hypothetical protein
MSVKVSRSARSSFKARVDWREGRTEGSDGREVMNSGLFGVCGREKLGGYLYLGMWQREVGRVPLFGYVAERSWAGTFIWAEFW